MFYFLFTFTNTIIANYKVNHYKALCFMKYILLFILVSMFCHAQEYNNVTAYRIIWEVDDCDCSIVTFLKTKGLNGTVYSAESTDQMMIKNLLTIKKQAKKWEKKDFWCSERSIGGDMIHNMFVFESSQTNDTLFTTREHLIVFPHEHLAYMDKNFNINKALNNHFKAFFDRDFNREYEDRILQGTVVLDSTGVDKILYKNIIGIQLNFPEIKNQTRSLKETDVLESVEDSIINYFYTYEADRDIILTKNNQSIESVVINNPDTFSIDGIKVGSSEELVVNRYPQSAKHTYPASTKFEEMEYKYNYKITFKNDKGGAVITVDKKVVSSIEVILR